MDPIANPFAPGAGSKPPLLVGRDGLISAADIAIKRAKAGKHGKSLIAVGLRGVGKTVVLNTIYNAAETSGFEASYIECHDDASLPGLILPKLRSSLIRLSKYEAAKEYSRRGLSILRNFASSFKISVGPIDVGLDLREEAGIADSGDLQNDLPELLVAVAEAAAARGTAMSLVIDEMQYLSEGELAALVMAIHRVNQRGLPLVLIGAALPPVLGKMGESKSYAERLFDFPRVEALSEQESFRALVEPAEKEGASFSAEALTEIFRRTRGYPYFLQEWGFVAWNEATSSPIDTAAVKQAEAEAVRRLDESFFRVRLERMTPTERKYMRAMAELGEGPHSSGNIASCYGAAVTTVAPLRSSLISKGMVYSPSYGNTEFTVPLFAEFMRREMPSFDRQREAE